MTALGWCDKLALPEIMATAVAEKLTEDQQRGLQSLKDKLTNLQAKYERVKASGVKESHEALIRAQRQIDEVQKEIREFGKSA